MQQDVIKIMCPSLTCRKVLAVPVSARGKTVRCRNCGTNIRIPPPKEAMDTPPATPDASQKKSA